MILKMKDKEIDLKACMPITLGDARRLKKEFGKQVDDLFSGDPDAVASLLLVLCQKVDKEVTLEHVDTLPLSQLKNVGAVINETNKEVDRPTSAPSTDSPSTTDGTSAQ